MQTNFYVSQNEFRMTRVKIGLENGYLARGRIPETLVFAGH